MVKESGEIDILYNNIIGSQVVLVPFATGLRVADGVSVISSLEFSS